MEKHQRITSAGVSLDFEYKKQRHRNKLVRLFKLNKIKKEKMAAEVANPRVDFWVTPPPENLKPFLSDGWFDLRISLKKYFYLYQRGCVIMKRISPVVILSIILPVLASIIGMLVALR